MCPPHLCRSMARKLGVAIASIAAGGWCGMVERHSYRTAPFLTGAPQGALAGTIRLQGDADVLTRNRGNMGFAVLRGTPLPVTMQALTLLAECELFDSGSLPSVIRIKLHFVMGTTLKQLSSSHSMRIDS